MTDRICNALLRHPALNLVGVVIVTVFFGWFLPRTEFDTSMKSWIREGDPSYDVHQEYQRTFSQKEVLVLAFKDERIFTRENLEIVQRLTERIGDVDNVYDVRSLTNTEYMKESEDGFDVIPLVDDPIPENAQALAASQKIGVTNPLFVKDLISPDGKSTSILITLRSVDEEGYMYWDEIGEIERIVAGEAERTGKDIYLVGETLIEKRFLQYTFRDLQMFIPATFLMLSVMVYLMFRNARDTVIAGLSIFASLIWTGGAVPLAGGKIDSVATGIPPLVLCIAVTDVVHIIHRYRKNLAGAADRTEALRAGLKEAMVPCFLTSLTTAVGFGSLMLNEVRTMKQFGLLAVIGVSFAFVACIVVVPSMLALWKERSTDDLGDRQFVPVRALTALSGFLLRRKRAIVAVTLGIVAVGVFGAVRMTPQLDNIDYLRRSSDVYKSAVFLEKNLVGTTQLDIWIESGQDGLMKEPATLQKIEDLSVFLRGLPGIDKVLSINDYLKEMNKAFNGDDPAHYTLPETRQKTAQFMLLYSMAGRKNELDNYLDYPCSRTRVSVRCSERRSAALDVLITRIQEYLGRNFEPPLEARLASNALVVNNIFNYIMKGLTVGLGLAVFLIFVVMCINFGSVKVGLVSMIPNVIPLVAAMALMGYFDIYLEIATAMTFSIALGIAVDDTIHFLARFREQLPRAGYDYAVAVRRTLEDLGSALTETTTIIVGGFLVLLVASLRMNVQFGLLCSFIVAMALVADMIFTPICMVLFKPFGKGPTA